VTDATSDGPVSLRLSVTDRCQLRCLYCMPPEGVQRSPRDKILRFEEIVRFVAALQRRVGLTKVRITGGEPLSRRGIVRLVEMLAAMGIADLAMTTNGQSLAESARDLKRAGLNRVNVSLDSLRAEVFRTITRCGELSRTLAGIDAALSAGLRPVKINVTVLRNVNTDELGQLVRFGLESGCEVRFIELMPIGPVAEGSSPQAPGGNFAKWFVSATEVLVHLAESFELRPLPRKEGSSSRPYAARAHGGVGGSGREGLISVIPSLTEPFCADCRRLRLTASGKLLGCLAREEGLDIRSLLREGGDERVLVRAATVAMSLKNAERDFQRQTAMFRIGG